MSLPESVISDINIDLPGGLGLVHGSGSVSLGPAHAPTDRPQRVAGATVPPHSIEPLAQLVFETEAPTRGMSGGGQLCGTDTTGIVAATMRFEPLDGGSRKVTISVKIIDPVGKPVRQVLPGVRFLHQFNAPNRLALGPEYGLLTVIDEFALPDFSQTIPATTVEFVEALVAISQRSGKDIAFPEADKLDEEDYANIINIGKLLRGELLPVTWTSTQVHIRADAVGSNFFSQGVVRTVQGLTFTFMGDSHDLGQFNTYLFSPRLDGDLNAKPGDDGTIALTIVPDKNNRAVTTSRDLAPDEAQVLSTSLDVASG